MRFQLTEDQRALRDGVRGLLARRFDRTALRAAVDRPGRLDRALWRELGAAGFFALRLPEADGGVGLGLPEAVLAFEETGRALLPGPLIATHLAAGHVPGAAEGEAVVAAVDGGGMVEWLTEADVVLAGGGGGGGGGGSGGAGDAGGVGGARGAGDFKDLESLTGLTGFKGLKGVKDVEGAVRVRSVDPLTPLHRVKAGGAGASVAVDPVAVLLTAAEQVGTATRACELAVQHARAREQFGQPIGAFQAVKHLCAELLVRVEVARAALYAAAVTADPADIAAARLLADEAAVRGARDCLQVHGGMGFTWESDVHLLLKRAWVRTRRAGSATESEELLADDLLSGVGR